MKEVNNQSMIENVDEFKKAKRADSLLWINLAFSSILFVSAKWVFYSQLDLEDSKEQP
jgi:hypothetical protein